MKANVMLKTFGHQPIHRTSRSRDEPQDIGTVLFICQSPLHSFDLAADSPDPQNELFLSLVVCTIVTPDYRRYYIGVRQNPQRRLRVNP
jgi:hypothetical protein